MLLVAAFSRHAAALDWARRKIEDTWGPVALESPRFEFSQTDYYEASMGPGLLKTFFALQRRCEAARLPEVKLLTNRWEEELRPRPDRRSRGR